MKRKSTIISCIMVVLMFVNFAILSCSNASPGNSAVTSWSIAGSIDYGGATSADVKLAAFYVPYGSTFPDGSALVSNVVNLGTTENASHPFSVSINASSVSPVLGDNIMLLVWQDDGSTVDVYDAGETYYMTFTATGCQVFENAVAAIMYYYDIAEPSLGIERGWNIQISLAGFKHINGSNSSFTGALIEDVYPWS